MKGCKSLCVTCIRADWDWLDLEEFLNEGRLAKINPMLSECFEKSKEFPRAQECEKYQKEVSK